MSLPPINPFAGMAANGPDDRRAFGAEREQNRVQTQISGRAVGDAESNPTEAAADRDADGRQNWQRPATTPAAEEEQVDGGEPIVEAHHSRDPYHERGNLLDIDG